MNIIREIKKSIEQHGLPFYYGSAQDINTILDRAEYPCCIALLVGQGAIEQENGQYKERLTLQMSFADLTTYDFDALENEDIIDECKRRAFVWLAANRNADNFDLSVNNTTRDYFEYDAIITGFGLNVDITERQGVGNCDIPLDVYAR